ncbi:DMT family transporter [Methylobacterium dankookense]|uniref:EamA domain-containing protein n=1 Tax=Methylobacterium dankookense TaxID=560405 RepID=A0A564FRI2_9HYPH|nr:DMT family transporter [Methylobacterium dankookense]GJD57174.1 hypothetical protein IFDJLNFL_3074 [Methylobacterium dankookense]VUF10793.1 hypothetical protein MTDSW087_00465 [Methylobacterium dankookense]
MRAASVGESGLRRTAPLRPLVDGLIGITIFAGSLVATRLALAGFEPVPLTLVRAAVAGLAAGLLLVCLRQPLPRRGDLALLFLVVLGVVFGFPLLTALALRHVGAGHATVFVGLLPLTTALFGALLAGERPSRAFWLLSGAGSLVTAGYAARGAGPGSALGDGLMLAAILVCGLGYAAGGRLARHLGGWQVIAWATVLALPVTLPVALLIGLPAAPPGASALLGLGYVSLFSMLIGFVFWYRALAAGGIAAIGQLQLLQPFLGLALAALVLGEAIEPGMPLAAALVAACVAGARRFA